MLGPLRRIGQRALFAIDPETAHGLSIAALKSGVPLCGRPTSTWRLETTVCGLAFDNPLGMAAGYDKNAEVPDALLRLGFGFVEVGTVTPLPQAGNPRPRVFRARRQADQPLSCCRRITLRTGAGDGANREFPLVTGHWMKKR